MRGSAAVWKAASTCAAEVLSPELGRVPVSASTPSCTAAMCCSTFREATRIICCACEGQRGAKGGEGEVWEVREGGGRRLGGGRVG
eukprot:4025577-Pyramimonas_sp.AAC.2